MQKDNIKRISLWSSPRNISTALMYSFAQRSDTRVYDEPLYAYYLANSNADEYHPSAEDILNTMENDGEKVVQMMLGANDQAVHFFKNMTHHLLDLERGFLKQLTNVILTRDPVEMLPSFAKVIPNPSMRDVGYALQTDLLKTLQEMNLPVIVIDSKSILLNPAQQLEKLCAAIDIPFDEAMLSWKVGARPEDGVWAKYWYASVHQSTQFQTYRPKTAPFPDYLKPLLEECQVHYEVLQSFTL